MLDRHPDARARVRRIVIICCSLLHPSSMALPQRIAPAAYLVAFALVVIPIFDASMTAFPPHFHDARWRFGIVGLLSNAVLFPVLGALIAVATAALLEHRKTQRALGALALVAVAVCVVAFGMFVLDALQTRAAVRPALSLSFTVASATAAVKLALASVTFCMLGLAGVRGGPQSSAKPASRTTNVLIGEAPRRSAP